MSFLIPADHPSLPGHFPGRPVVPGVVLLDRVLDAVVAQQPQLSLERLRWPQVKFLQPLLPGQAAEVALEALPPLADAPRWRFRVVRDGQVLAHGEVAAMGSGTSHD